jgi:non-haem dioxygenase in morphine synthesis N-terminal
MIGFGIESSHSRVPLYLQAGAAQTVFEINSTWSAVRRLIGIPSSENEVMSKDTIIKDYYVEPANVPVVDFQLLNSSDDAKRHAAVELLDEAFREFGFVQIYNHTIGPEKVDLAFEWVRLIERDLEPCS